MLHHLIKVLFSVAKATLESQMSVCLSVTKTPQKNDPDVLEMVLKTSLEAEDGIQAASMSSSFLLSLVSVTVGETGLTWSTLSAFN